MSLSAESQHVIDSLEAHLAAVKAAADGADEPELIEAAAQFGEDVLELLREWGVGLRQGAQASTNGADSAVDAPAASELSQPAPGDVGAAKAAA